MSEFDNYVGAIIEIPERVAGTVLEEQSPNEAGTEEGNLLRSSPTRAFMASPQKENGYTAIANEILDALCRTRISGEARQVLDVILRKTYGYNKKADHISLSQFVEATGIHKPEVCRALHKLEEMNIIAKSEGGVANRYVFVKNYESWKPLAKKQTLAKKPMTVGNIANNRWQKSHIQKTKDNITKDTASNDAGLVSEVIKSFEEVNPSYKKWYGNTTQRGAVHRLITTHGVETVKRVITLLPKTNNMRYFPTITTPLQLEDKWAQLESALKRMKTKREVII